MVDEVRAVLVDGRGPAGVVEHAAQHAVRVLDERRARGGEEPATDVELDPVVHQERAVGREALVGRRVAQVRVGAVLLLHERGRVSTPPHASSRRGAGCYGSYVPSTSADRRCWRERRGL